MGKFVAGLVAALLVVGVAVAFATGGLRIGGRQSGAVAGDVVLKKLQERDDLVVGSGVFQVPVKACTDVVVAFTKEGRNEEGVNIQDYCNGPLSESSTLIVEGQVDAVVRLRDVRVEDGDRRRVEVPQPKLAAPVVDGEKTIEVAHSSNWVPGTNLDRDFQAKASGVGKEAIAQVAADSGLLTMARASAEKQLENLFSFDGKPVDVVFVRKSVGDG